MPYSRRGLNDEKSPVVRAAGQIAAGAFFVIFGLILEGGSDVSPSLGATADLLIKVGLVWAAVWIGLLAWAAFRLTSLREAVSTKGVVEAVRRLRSYTDDARSHEYVYVKLAVNRRGSPPRTLWLRESLTKAQRQQLVVGAKVPVRVHPSRPVGQLDLSGQRS